MHFLDQRFDGRFIEIYICNGCKQAFDEQLIGILSRLGVAVCRTGKSDQSSGQLILQPCDISFLAAYSGSSCTCLAACRLFTLKTKHLCVHYLFLLWIFYLFSFGSFYYALDSVS